MTGPAAELTGRLLAPGRASLPAGTRLALTALLGTAAEGGAGRPVDAFALGPPPARDDGPFAWSPRTGRRRIGLAALTRWRDGRADLRRAVAEAMEDVAAGDRTPGTLAAWLADAPAGARAALQAEALTWATRLATGLDWERLGPTAEVGRPDRFFRVAGGRGPRLRGRTEVALPRAAGPALLSVLGGTPGPAAPEQVVLPALVDVLARPDDPPPARALGWWPDCGRVVEVPVTAAALRGAARAVLRRVGTAAPAPATPAHRAAAA
jgi:hypothetical protein